MVVMCHLLPYDVSLSLSTQVGNLLLNDNIVKYVKLYKFLEPRTSC